MIFASDLDRTLIFSQRAIEELGMPEKTNLKPVEKKEGKWVAFMTESSFSYLKHLCHQHLFIPVTTRTTDQFNRIHIFQNDLPISYAITANGATVLLNGEASEEWSELIFNKMKRETALTEELLLFLDKEGFSFNGKIKFVENLFFYYILENPLSMEEKKKVSSLVSSYGWRVSLQGRKLYFLPKAINKGEALQYICHITGENAVAGAGDSILDWDFLHYCKHQYVPIHGELVQEISNTGFVVTQQRGIMAGEEILRQYLTF